MIPHRAPLAQERPIALCTEKRKITAWGPTPSCDFGDSGEIWGLGRCGACTQQPTEQSAMGRDGGKGCLEGPGGLRVQRAVNKKDPADATVLRARAARALWGRNPQHKPHLHGPKRPPSTAPPSTHETERPGHVTRGAYTFTSASTGHAGMICKSACALVQMIISHITAPPMPYGHRRLPVYM